MLPESFPETVHTQVGSQGSYALTIRDSIQHNHQGATVAEVHGNLPLIQVQSTVVQPEVRGKKQHKGRVRWTISETLALINAKQVEKNLPFPGGFIKQNKSAIEKWRITSAQCQANGLDRTATQCRDRWDHIQPDYKKIRHYERNIVSAHDSYWNMTTKERIDKKLPANFTKEIFDAMEKHFGQNRTVHPGEMVIDTSASDYGTLEDHNTPAGSASQHKNSTFETPLQNRCDTSADRDVHVTGKKRKVVSTSTGIKSTLTENNKKIISNLKLAEQGHAKRHEKYCSMFERRMEIDEKYLKDYAGNVQRMIYMEEQKVKAQHELVSSLNTIGQAMFKIWHLEACWCHEHKACWCLCSINLVRSAGVAVILNPIKVYRAFYLFLD